MAAPWRQPSFRFGAGLLATIALVAAFGPLVHVGTAGQMLAPPSWQHWLGTDDEGLDIATQIIAGSRLALVVGVGFATLSVGLGLALGTLAGYFGGVPDLVISWVADLLLCFPGVLLALLVVFVTDRAGVTTLVVTLAATGWAGHARLARALADKARQTDAVVAARCLGASHWHVIWYYVLPDLAGPLLVQGTLAVATGVLAEASLSFLGLGPQGTASWGAMLEQGAALVLRAPLLLLAASGALLALVTAVNMMGDGLRDALDPRSPGASGSRSTGSP